MSKFCQLSEVHQKFLSFACINSRLTTSTVYFVFPIYEMVLRSSDLSVWLKHPQCSVLSQVTCKAYTWIKQQHLAHPPSLQTIKNCKNKSVKTIIVKGWFKPLKRLPQGAHRVAIMPLCYWGGVWWGGMVVFVLGFGVGFGCFFF